MTLQKERHNSITTRNTRLAALHTFARFLALQRPQRMAQLQTILNVPFKRGAREAPIEYFDGKELDAFFKSIDRKSICGLRDYAQLFQVVSQRYKRGSIVLTTNRPFKRWAQILNNDSTLTSALLDRLLHHAEVVVIEGPSLRGKDIVEADTAPPGPP